MPYGDTSVLPTTVPWPEPAPRGRGLRLLPLALATILSFAAGVGSTLVYLEAQQGELRVAEAPLIEADKAPTRVRPEGLSAAPPAALASPAGAPETVTAQGLPSAISSAMAMPPPVPAIELTAQGIPAAPEIVPPARAEIVEVATTSPIAVPPPVAPEPVVPAAEPASTALAEIAPAGPEIRLQVASWRSPEKAVEEMNRFKQVHASVVAALEFEVQRLDQGARGVFYRVLSSPVDGRDEAAALCAALAERRGQCQVMTFAPRPETRLAEAPAAPVLAAQTEAQPAAPATQTPPPVAAAPAAAPGEVRAQLATLRTFEGATRELNRLARVYGGVLEQTELSVSRIDQGERGVFFRILTAPLPSRDAAGDLCQRLGSGYAAGCVLIPQRPTA